MTRFLVQNQGPEDIPAVGSIMSRDTVLVCSMQQLAWNLHYLMEHCPYHCPIKRGSDPIQTCMHQYINPFQSQLKLSA
jgi:hypothetical protein